MLERDPELYRRVRLQARNPAPEPEPESSWWGTDAAHAEIRAAPVRVSLWDAAVPAE